MLNFKNHKDAQLPNGSCASFYKKFFALVLPMALQNFMNALVNASDALMLGFLDQDSLSAVSLAGQVQFIFGLILGALCIGETVLVAQYWGKGDKDAVERVLGIVLMISISVSLFFFFATSLLPGTLMHIFTNDTELIKLGIPYLKIISISYLFQGISQIYLCIMKNTNRAFRSMIYGSCSVITNIIFNAILIFGMFGMPSFGIRGAAIATSMARTLEILLICTEHMRKNIVRIRPSRILRPQRAFLGQYIHYTWPSLANQLIWGLGFTMFSVIMGHLGSDAVAANSIAQIVKNMAACFCLGIGAGTGILVGNELGAGRLEEARRLGDKLCKVSLMAGFCSCLVLVACIPLILHFVTVLSDQSSLYLKCMLMVCSYYMIGKSFSATLIGGIFSAGGDTRFGLICDSINMWAIIVPLGMLAAFVWKLPVPLVYFLLNLDEFTKMPAEYWYYRKYKWVKNITENSEK